MHFLVVCVLVALFVLLFETPWAVFHQALLSVKYSMQEYWSGLPCPSPGDLPDPGIKFGSLVTPVLTGGFFTTFVSWEP